MSLENKISNTKDEMPFLSHLEALRWHFVRSLVAVVTISIVVFVNKSFVFDTIILAPKNINFITYKFLCKLSEQFNFGEVLCINKISFTVTNIDMTGQFTIHLFVSFILGAIIASPYVFWEFWSFVKPALYTGEKKSAKGAVFFISLLFIAGVLFGYYLIAPLSINFLGSYQVSEEITNQINLGSYINTLSMLCLASGAVFELPMLVYFLSKIGLVTPQFMRNYRRHAIVVLLIIAGVITPPDVTSQILVCFPLILLYEISIFISAYVVKGSTKG